MGCNGLPGGGDPTRAVNSIAERWSLSPAHRGGLGNDSHVFLVFLSGRPSHVKDIQVDLSGVTKRLRNGGLLESAGFSLSVSAAEKEIASGGGLLLS